MARTAVQFGYIGSVTLPVTGIVAELFEWTAQNSRVIHVTTTWPQTTNAKEKTPGEYMLTG